MLHYSAFFTCTEKEGGTLEQNRSFKENIKWPYYNKSGEGVGGTVFTAWENISAVT